MKLTVYFAVEFPKILRVLSVKRGDNNIILNLFVLLSISVSKTQVLSTTTYQANCPADLKNLKKFLKKNKFTDKGVKIFPLTSKGAFKYFCVE